MKGGYLIQGNDLGHSEEKVKKAVTKNLNK